MGPASSTERSGAVDPARFFDRLGPSYGSRYKGEDAFHHYYFQERMAKAIRGLDLSDAHVLDIGSGTGDLYGALAPRFPRMHFLASDVSEGMLAHSLVPPAQRLLGHIYEHDLGEARFDAIFMLGVTTYMNADELEKNLAFAARHLAPEGRFVATFTHADALDSRLRSLAKGIMGRRSGNSDNVLTSGLRIHQYGFRAAKSILERHFRVEDWDGLNHTVFPFNRLFPKESIGLAKRLARHQGKPAWLRFLSSDLLFHAGKR